MDSPAARLARGRELMREIGEEYDRLRTDSRAKGWADLQRKLMRSMHILVPETVSLDQVISMSLKIEEFLKTEQGNSSMHPIEALEKWLNESPNTSAAASEPDDTDGATVN